MPWGVLVEAIKTDALPEPGKIWAFGCESIRYDELIALQKELGPKAIHSLRHSLATHLLEAGVEITIVQRLLGHSSLSTTSNYLHVRQERLAQIKSPLQLLDLRRLPTGPQA